jgi:hypothetical protein
MLYGQSEKSISAWIWIVLAHNVCFAEAEVG